ncbi:RNA-binding protein [Luteipulveratus mongoliensis]|uniref:RNA-binding protein n=1 Tax=Luteipulveratus mongoliensis TaxID=571913 RepID=A0A0K1JPC1_9MICO|nr:DciA family protein [Luteipulveratus mongoliensis]AKU18567.1 RNA-binding protein [Luteipulveratus mongoliensis]
MGPQPVSENPADDTVDAAAAALARVRRAARDRGLRPGSPAIRRRKAGDRGRWSAREDRAGRDPQALGDQVDRLMRDRDWRVDVAAGAVMGRWEEIVGADVAQHTAPVTFQDSVLTVRAESTAWATQLRLLSSTILGRMEQAVGADVVVELRVVGPSAPSWSRGLRKVHGGKGPRDTYG